MDVDESYVVAAFVIAEESLSLGSCDADAGVVDVDLVVVVMLDEACFDLPAFRTFEDAVDDGVFYEGLKEKGGTMMSSSLSFGKSYSIWRRSPKRALSSSV